MFQIKKTNSSKLNAKADSRLHFIQEEKQFYHEHFVSINKIVIFRVD